MRSSPNSKRAVKKRLADGTVKTYFYDRARKPREERYGEGSIGALIVAYQISPEYRALTKKTKDCYRIALSDLAEHQFALVADFKRKDILFARDAVAVGRGAASANAFVRFVSMIFSWAVDRGWIEYSPAMKIKSLPTGHLPAWSEEHARVALARLPEHLRRVVVLGLHTGQRRGDLISMPWSAYQDGVLRIWQKKTMKPTDPPLIIPVHSELKAELDHWMKERSSIQILTTQTGRVWIGENLSREMTRELKKIGIPAGFNIHGLRKLAATRLAQSGCSAHEIASITGHKTLAMVQLYTASADQERLAKAAVLRLETGFKKDAKTASN